MIIESSKDILYLIIAFGVLWLTIFCCWFIYYVAMIFRQFNLLITELREQLDKIDRLLDAIREKVEKSASYTGVIAEGIKQGLLILKEKRDGAGKKAGKKRSFGLRRK